MFRLERLRNLGCAGMLIGVLCPNARAQVLLPNIDVTRSVSGQFIVAKSQPSLPSFVQSVNPDSNSIRLNPALLAVSAERIKQALWRKIGLEPNAPWRGRIVLALHPARYPDEKVTVVSQHFADGWNYRVAFPDVLSRTRFMRAMTSVVLLEFANRGADEHSADIPAWLTEGLSQELLATGSVEIVLSPPVKKINGLLESRIDTTQQGIDPIAGARRVLADHSALTFDELSWPTESQLSGDDGGVYRASAQLFADELLKLRNGPAQLRSMLQMLPQYYNWQTAFQKAFRAEFARPLDVEKWWELQVVAFISRDSGPTWTPAVSRKKLDQILSVPVDFRSASNALPVHATVSLQAVIRNFNVARQRSILESKLHDLEVAQFRVARSLAVLTAGYRMVLADYLGENRGFRRHFWNKYPRPRKISATVALRRLDTLDEQRRTVELAVKPDVLRP